MARNLLLTVGKCEPDNGVADTLVYQKRVPITLSVAGEYKRYQLLVIDETGAATIPTASTMEIDGILLDDIGTIDGTEEVPAAASLTGEWNENVVSWGAIPDANKEAVKTATAKHQLYIGPMAKAPYVQFGEVI